MWEQNIDVTAIGDRNRVLRFTGAIFANNQAIAVARDELGDTIEILRFDQDRYEWYRGSEYTYFKRSSLPDGAFANFNGSSWTVIDDKSHGKGRLDGKCDPDLAKEAGLSC